MMMFVNFFISDGLDFLYMHIFSTLSWCMYLLDISDVEFIGGIL